jgi:tRNA(fMet)-specific endonuclease VapC
MFDTNIVSHIVRYPQGVVASRLRARGERLYCVSVIVAAELRFGIAKLGSERLGNQVENALATLDILPFDVPCDSVYAQIRTYLESRGTIISPNDLFIAAHALALDLTLVTANTREFSRVPNLRLENWLD